MFSEVVIVIGDGHTRDLLPPQSEAVFSLVLSLYEAKPFRLVFSLEIWDGNLRSIAERLKLCVDEETAKGGLDFLPCPPIIIANTRAARCPPRLCEGEESRFRYTLYHY